MRIAVLGGGNGSFAAAGDFALAGHEVRFWRRDKSALAAQRAAGGTILVKGKGEIEAWYLVGRRASPTGQSRVHPEPVRPPEVVPGA